MSNVSSITKLLTMRLPNDLHDRLKAHAEQTGQTVTACVTQAISDYLETSAAGAERRNGD